jgi:hypothetical protein
MTDQWYQFWRALDEWSRHLLADIRAGRFLAPIRPPDEASPDRGEEAFDWSLQRKLYRDFIDPEVSINRPPVSQESDEVGGKYQAELPLCVIKFGLRVAFRPFSRRHRPNSRSAR